jgi:hypothetical protein
MRRLLIAFLVCCAGRGGNLHSAPVGGDTVAGAVEAAANLAYVRPPELTPSGVAEPVRVSAISDQLRAEYKLDPFYHKTVVVDGIPIIGSARVSDYALLECAWVIDHMLAGCDKIKAALRENKVRVGILAATEYTMDIPENQRPRMLAEAAYHDRRSRGLGGEQYATCGEENLLSLAGDPYRSENITIHEFAHTIASNLRRVDRPWWDRLEDLYQQALAEGLWANTYAATNEQEYWAEATQSWFDCNTPRADGRVHNGIWNRDSLKAYDPRMAAFLAETFGDGPWRYSRTITRPADQTRHLAGLDRAQMPEFSFANSPRVQADPDAGRTASRRNRRRETTAESTVESTPESTVESDAAPPALPAASTSSSSTEIESER